MIPVLADEHSVVVGIRTLRTLCRKLARLFRRKNHTSVEEVAAFVQTKIDRM